jgi:gas vesicle structural protein
VATVPLHAKWAAVRHERTAGRVVSDIDNTSLELSDLINRVLDKGAVIAGSVTISVADIDLVQLDVTIVLTAIETARANERRRRESAESGS